MSVFSGELESWREWSEFEEPKSIDPFLEPRLVRLSALKALSTGGEKGSCVGGGVKGPQKRRKGKGGKRLSVIGVF